MRDTTILTRRGHHLATALLLALTLSGPVTALAQSGDSEKPAQTDDPVAPTTDEREDSRSETADGAEGVVLSPFDYEASESISEDASVSFPVDI